MSSAMRRVGTRRGRVTSIVSPAFTRRLARAGAPFTRTQPWSISCWTADRERERSTSVRKRSRRSPAREVGTGWTFEIGVGAAGSGEVPGKEDHSQGDRGVRDVEHGPADRAEAHVDEIDDPAPSDAIQEIAERAPQDTPQEDAVRQAAIGIAREEVEHHRD